MRRTGSIAPDYFEKLYADHGDPWAFETSAYEAEKYDHTLAALPRPRYARTLEVGCANGVLTRRLAERCDDLLAIDVSDTALAAARVRCADLGNIRFEKRQLPGDAPAGPFDLVMLSEVVYYWDCDDIARAGAWLRGAVASGGDVLLVHWTGETDYPLSGDDAVAALADAARFAEVAAERREEYRLDLWRKQ